MINVRKSLFKLIRTLNVEACFWIGGLCYLALIDPATGGHLNLCLHKWLGFDWCPGCGLGTSISYMLHGNLTGSFEAHPLGGIALVVITVRLIALLKDNYKYNITLKNRQITI
jgi:hypothetical protein